MYLKFPGCSEIIHVNKWMIFLWTVNLGGAALYRYSIKSWEAEVPEIVHDLLVSQKNESRLKCLLQLTVSVQDQSSGRSLGTDRLMAELCKDLWPLIRSSLYLLFIKCSKLDPLPICFRKTTVRPTFYKGDHGDIKIGIKCTTWGWLQNSVKSIIITPYLECWCLQYLSYRPTQAWIMQEAAA